MELKKCTFVVAMRYFFGPKPGDTLQQFAAELRELTPADKAEFSAMLKNEGYDVQESA